MLAFALRSLCLYSRDVLYTQEILVLSSKVLI
jgi:hypothetical protein